jgi:uncharacterized protein
VDYEQLILSFTSIIYEALPFIVLGVVIAGLLEEFVPQQALSRIVTDTNVLVAIYLTLVGAFSFLPVAAANLAPLVEGNLVAPFLAPFLTGVYEVRWVFWVAALALWAMLPIAILFDLTRRYLFPSIFPGKLILAVGVGSLLGLVFPMCECGIIVVMKRLLRKGLPLSVCVAYVLAGPVINVVVMTSTYVAFNPPQERDYILGGPIYVVAWRVGLSYIIAITTGLIVNWQWNKHGVRLLHPSIIKGLKETEPEAEVAFAWGNLARILLFILMLGPIWWVIRYLYVQIRSGESTIKERLNNITQTALHDFVDIMAFLVLGAILAAGGKYAMQEGGLQEHIQKTPAVAILLMMVIAVLFCLCSEADAFVAANFPAFWPPASKLAFLVLGPMLDLKLYLMYTRVFRPRLIFTIISSVVIQVFTYTMLVHYVPIIYAEMMATGQ